MADEPENCTLALLGEMRADIVARFSWIDGKLDRIADDLQNIKVRMTRAEEAIAGVNRRLDRLETRVERIEKRLDLVEA